MLNQHGSQSKGRREVPLADRGGPWNRYTNEMPIPFLKPTLVTDRRNSDTHVLKRFALLRVFQPRCLPDQLKHAFFDLQSIRDSSRDFP